MKAVGQLETRELMHRCIVLNSFHSRSLGHGLHSSGDGDGPLLGSSKASEHHALGCEGDGLHAGRTDLVDRRRVRRLGQTSSERNLSGRRLSSSSLDNLDECNGRRKNRNQVGQL